MTLELLDITQHAGLVYQHAFDWLAANLHVADGPAAYKVSSAWQLLEMARRLPEVPALDPDPAWQSVVAQALGCEERTVSGIDGSLWAAIGLVEPRLADQHLFESFRQSLRPGGHLFVIADGPMSRFLEERRRDSDPMPAEAKVIAAARAVGFRVVQRLGVHTPAAVARHYIGEVALVGGWRAACDRQHFAMRRAMVTSGPSATLSALVCLTLERGS